MSNFDLIEMLEGDKECIEHIAALEAELSQAISYRKERERELGGVIADQDRRIEELEAEVARLTRESAAHLREIGQWVEASKDIFASDHMFARHKAETQRDQLAEALRPFADMPTEEDCRWAFNDGGKVYAIDHSDFERARAALTQLEEK